MMSQIDVSIFLAQKSFFENKKNNSDSFIFVYNMKMKIV